MLDEQSSDPHNVESVSLDGGMAHIRDEGWKEFKVGSVSALRRQAESSSGQAGATVALSDPGYTAALGEVNAFAPAVWASIHLSLKHLTA